MLAQVPGSACMKCGELIAGIQAVTGSGHVEERVGHGA